MAARKKTTTRKTTRKSTAKRTTAKKKTAKKKTAAKKKPAKKKTTAKKTTARKTTAKKSARKPAKKTTAKRKTTAKKSAKKAAPKKVAGPISVGRKPFTKSQLVGSISDQTGLSRSEVNSVLEAASNVINAHVKKKGPGTFSWPGLFKIIIKNKPAVAARWGVNPFTGEKMKFKAKPASRQVKIRPLKGLKEMAKKAA